MMMNDNERKIKKAYDNLLSENKVVAYRTKHDEDYILVRTKNQSVFGNIQSKRVITALKRLFYEYDNEFLGLDNDFLIPLIQMSCYENKLSYDFVHRIYFDGTDYIYDLNQDDGLVLLINREQISIVHTDEIFFKRGIDYKQQIDPDLNSPASNLLGYVKKHFNISTDEENILFTLYLVSCFIPNINCPILNLYGEKGSGKSTFLRKVRDIVSPSSADLTGMPKNLDDLALRLCNTYYTCIDNCSSIRREFSDLLARSCTGGSITKRKLYTDSDETLVNIKTHVAINSVSMVAKESDLLDRSLILHLSRVESEEMLTEEKLWESFKKDMPQILGSIFNILAEVLYDDEPIETTRLVRLADWHEKCIKIGRCLDIDEEKVNEIIWNNQHNVNRITLDEDIISYTLISLLKRKKGEYTGSMSDLLKTLKLEARQLAVSDSLLPKTPNHLSARLRKVQSNLEQEYGIVYSIKNKGAFKEITIIKKKK